MDKSENHVAQGKRLIGQASDMLAQLQRSILHTQQLIDASTRQMQEIRELLSRVEKCTDLMRHRELLRLGSGDRANDPAKDTDAPCLSRQGQLQALPAPVR